MQEKDELFDIMHSVVEGSPAEQTEIYLQKDYFSQVRIANSEISENVYHGNGRAIIRVISAGRQGYVSVSSLDAKDLQAGLKKCVELVQFRPSSAPQTTFRGPQQFSVADAVDIDTAQHRPEQKVKVIQQVIHRAEKNWCKVAGTFKTNFRQTAIVNSNGLELYFPETIASLSLIAFRECSSGFAQETSRSVLNIDSDSVVKRAVDKCVYPSIGSIEPGEYTVIMEPEAVADLLFFLGMFTFNAEVLQDGMSYVEGKFGEKIVGDNISIWDDGFDPSGLVMPFDAEGAFKQRVDLIKGGLANAVVYDLQRAIEKGQESTGHSLLPNSDISCMPLNLFMQGGTTSLEEIVESTEFGIYITRFHYTNLVDPKKTILTGMTRDGTFLIRNGKIVGSINNLRFVQSIVDTLANVEKITADRQLCYDGQLCCVVPGLKIKKFNFTG